MTAGSIQLPKRFIGFYYVDAKLKTAHVDSAISKEDAENRIISKHPGSTVSSITIREL